MKKSTQYLDGAEPLYIRGSNVGCLLLHGAGGGTAWDLKEFANIFHLKTGATVWLPSLKGFGTRPEDLYGITFTDWMDNAHAGVKKLQQQCDQIFVVGHSVGGLLALLLAAERKEINVVATWAAPINIKHRMIKFLPIISKIQLLKRLIPKKVHSTAPEELKEKGWVGYNWIPSSIGIVVLEGINRVKKSLHKITCPTFIVQGTNDEVVAINSAKMIYQNINSSIKKLWYVEGARHTIMNDEPYNIELFESTIEFFSENSS